MVDREVDLTHPSVRKWLRIDDADPTAPPPKPPSGYVPTREMFTRLAYAKRLEEVRRLRHKNQVEAGALIELEFVRQHVYGIIDATWRRLLTDTPRTLVRRVFAMARTGESIDLAEAFVRDTISAHLRTIKTEAARSLREDPPR